MLARERGGMPESENRGAEARDAYRADVSFPATYRDDVEDVRAAGELRDISASGARLVAKKIFAPEAIVELAFTLPEGLLSPVRVEETYEWGRPYRRHISRLLRGPAPFAPMTVRAQIVGAGISLGIERYAYGVHFVDLDTETREEIHRFVHLWQRRQLRVRRTQRENTP